MPRETPLVGRHRELGARMTEFAGWLMPIQYTGIVDEHKAVREAAGLFDVSHMGEIWFTGLGALETANRLVTNDLESIQPGACLYSPMCNLEGGIVDDVIMYRVGEDVLFVVNAANTAKDLAWILERCRELGSRARVEDRSMNTVQIALQGPAADEVVRKVGLAELVSLGRNRHIQVIVEGKPVLASRTGYTGEAGFEFYHDWDAGDFLWEMLFEAGRGSGIKPIGLGARDTLRFEMGYCLYGNDIDDSTSPLEAGLGWTVKLDKLDFVGKQALVAEKAAGVKRKLVGMELLETGIARQGCAVKADGKEVGHVTSGTFSPSLGKGLAMGYLEAGLWQPGTEVQIAVRDKELKARVTRLPFYVHGSRK
ncbi:MAG: glycine cleavage system aminomethyltransferase GcvT [Candidatus Eisenbacteria bacterium]|nr:glycine cleavage system aminomethyltransferase GcvT [Candidatus Eisenbacteria bacterium]